MPKVVRFYQTGGPEVLKVEDLPLAEPGKGEVRLKVEAIGLNRAEVMFRNGQYLEVPQFPSRLGYEAAGIIDAVVPAQRDSNRATVSARNARVDGTRNPPLQKSIEKLLRKNPAVVSGELKLQDLFNGNSNLRTFKSKEHSSLVPSSENGASCLVIILALLR